MGARLGEGGFSTCYEITDVEKKRKYACKLVTIASLALAGNSKKKLKNEIKVHMSLKSSYVCRLVHYFQDNDYVYIILDLCTNGTLESLLKNRKRLHTLEVQFFV